MIRWGFERINNPNGCIFISAPDYAAATERIGGGYRLIATTPGSALRQLKGEGKNLVTPWPRRKSSVTGKA
jgi:hypothetical protein